MTQNPFDRSGMASIDDLSLPHWRPIFDCLETVQAEFLAVQPFDADYPWPRDPLHNFIRVWEYPYAYHHLKEIVDNCQNQPMREIEAEITKLRGESHLGS